MHFRLAANNSFKSHVVKETDRCGLTDWLTDWRFRQTVYLNCNQSIYNACKLALFCCVCYSVAPYFKHFLGDGERHRNHGTLFRYQSDLRRDHTWYSYNMLYYEDMVPVAGWNYRITSKYKFKYGLIDSASPSWASAYPSSLVMLCVAWALKPALRRDVTLLFSKNIISYVVSVLTK